jgi:ribosomal protein S18 acetylase RimI-like enzyme
MEIRPANINDLDSIIRLYESELLRKANPVFIKTSIEMYPVFIALEGDELVGFVYCRKFSPDILEPANILVKKEFRSSGIGSRLLAEVERVSAGSYQSLILVNSTLYKEDSEKRDASNFYLKNGYVVILETKGSTVFSKDLGSN